MGVLCKDLAGAIFKIFNNQYGTGPGHSEQWTAHWTLCGPDVPLHPAGEVVEVAGWESDSRGDIERWSGAAPTSVTRHFPAYRGLCSST